MNKTDLASTIAQKTGVSVKDANAVIGGLNDVILEAVGRGEKIQLPGPVSYTHLTLPTKA